jgi:lipid-binding SYLF domain-containing protein
MVRSLTGLAIVCGLAAPAVAAPPPRETIDRSAEVIADIESMPLKAIPTKLITEAQAIAVIPRVIKAGFVVGGRVGFGLVMTRTEKGEWSDPTFVRLGGASVGFQAGVESTDVVLVFKKRESLDRVLSGKGKLTLGADASVAAGPVGRTASAATDGKLEAEIFSYSKSRGLFAGVSLSGAGLVNDRETNADYVKDARPETVRAVAELKRKVMEVGVAKP